MELKFNPSGGSAVHKSAGMGLSILACGLVSAADRELSIQCEEALLESKRNQTLEEACKMSTNDPRHPPLTFHKLCLLTLTYASLLYVLFGSQCNHFRKMWNIYNMNEGQECGGEAT